MLAKAMRFEVESIDRVVSPDQRSSPSLDLCRAQKNKRQNWKVAMKAGSKLKSAVCDTEVMVIKAQDQLIECGGHAMLETAPGEKGLVDPNFADGSKVGKRYVNADGSIELLCVNAGAGSLAIGGEKLNTKEAKPLPSSD